MRETKTRSAQYVYTLQCTTARTSTLSEPFLVRARTPKGSRRCVLLPLRVMHVDVGVFCAAVSFALSIGIACSSEEAPALVRSSST